MLCAQVAGIGSQPQFESVSLSRTHHPIHNPPSPISLPIPDSQFHSQSQTQSQLLAFPGPSACLFVCSCLSSVPPQFPCLCSAHLSAVDCQSVLVTLQLLYISVCPLSSSGCLHLCQCICNCIGINFSISISIVSGDHTASVNTAETMLSAIEIHKASTDPLKSRRGFRPELTLALGVAFYGAFCLKSFGLIQVKNYLNW